MSLEERMIKTIEDLKTRYNSHNNYEKKYMVDVIHLKEKYELLEKILEGKEETWN